MFLLHTQTICCFFIGQGEISIRNRSSQQKKETNKQRKEEKTRKTEGRNINHHHHLPRTSWSAPKSSARQKKPGPPWSITANVTTCQNIQIKNTKYINNHLERKKSNKSSLELAFFILFDLIIINSTCLFWVRECLASRQTLYSTRHCVCVCVCIGRVAAGAVMDCSWSP